MKTSTLAGGVSCRSGPWGRPTGSGGGVTLSSLEKFTHFFWFLRFLKNWN